MTTFKASPTIPRCLIIVIVSLLSPLSVATGDATTSQVHINVRTEAEIIEREPVTADNCSGNTSTTCNSTTQILHANRSVHPVIGVTESIQPRSNTGSSSSNASTPVRGGEWVRINPSSSPDFYIMKYEASRADEADLPISQQGVKPWNTVTQANASDACQRLGGNYDLPTNKEWQAATGAPAQSRSEALGGNTDGWYSTDKPCTRSQSPGSDSLCLTGSGPSHWVSSTGTVDMVGNLWEWTSTVINTTQDGLRRQYGYISAWDREQAYPDALSKHPGDSFGESLFFASNGSFVVRRGGSWTTGNGAGPYSMSLDRSPDERQRDIGFRCVYHPS